MKPHVHHNFVHNKQETEAMEEQWGEPRDTRCLQQHELPGKYYAEYNKPEEER